MENTEEQMTNDKHRFLRIEIHKLFDEAEKKGRNLKEICGMIVDNGFFYELVPIRNIQNRIAGFRFDRMSVRNVLSSARILGHEIVGTYHSHPTMMFGEKSLSPTESDIENTPDGSLMLILAGECRRMALWHIKNKRAIKLRYRIIGDQ